MQWHPFTNLFSVEDAEKRAAAVFGLDIHFDRYGEFTPEEFDQLHVIGIRAQRGKTLREMFPDHDRPRGWAHFSNVVWQMNNKCSPIIVARMANEELRLLDGEHRLVAAYFMNSTIRVAFFFTSTIPPLGRCEVDRILVD